MSRLIDRPLQTYLGRLRRLRCRGELPRPAVRAHGREAVRLRPPRDERHRRGVPRLPAGARLPAGRAARRSGVPADALPLRARRARHGVIVVLVGEGSDEVFGGYDDMAHVAERRVAALRARAPPAALRARRPARGRPRCCARPPGRIDVLRRARDGQPLYWGLDVVFWDNEKDELLDAPRRATRSASTGARGRRCSCAALRRAAPRASPARIALQQMSSMELCNRLPELLLMRVDKLSMAHSIEARAPFLDAALVAYGLSLPARAQDQRQDRRSTCCKQALRGVVPDEVLDRPKQGFRVPLPAWLRGQLAQLGQAPDLRAARSASRGFFNRALRSTRCGTATCAGVQDHSFDLWCLVNLGAWYAHWIEAEGGMSGAAPVLYVVDGLGLSRQDQGAWSTSRRPRPRPLRARSSRRFDTERRARSTSGCARGRPRRATSRAPMASTRASSRGWARSSGSLRPAVDPLLQPAHDAVRRDVARRRRPRGPRSAR